MCRSGCVQFKEIGFVILRFLFDLIRILEVSDSKRIRKNHRKEKRGAWADLYGGSRMVQMSKWLGVSMWVVRIMAQRPPWR